MSGWITLITNEWRLKLLAFLLAVLMLGAVAFSQNPPTTRSLSVPLDYNYWPDRFGNRGGYGPRLTQLAD